MPINERKRDDVTILDIKGKITIGAGDEALRDAVHRVLGRPGIILVGEGVPSRVRGLIAQEKKKIALVMPPIRAAPIGS